jgi:catechol 2,3-dioxygenase-like lactoylglutathione lyase family enzyme
MPAPARFIGLSLDCDDPVVLAAFYTRLLGAEVTYSSDEFVFLGEPALGFAKVDKYVPPTWPSPDVPKQAHLEFGVDDLDAGEQEVLAIGATKPDFQPHPDRWRVLLDPAGHPFCLSTATV